MNISITNFTSNYSNNTLCTYAGIAFYEVIGNTYSEKHSLCTDEGNFYKYRNVYLTGSQILVVLYAYRKYGMMHISMKIKTSKCKLTQTNVYMCAYSFYCSKKHFHIHRNKQLCIKLIRESDVQTNFDARFFAGSSIRQKEGGCIIFQFTQEVNLFVYKITTYVKRLKYCGTIFKTAQPKTFNKKITCEAMGFFTGKDDK